MTPVPPALPITGPTPLVSISYTTADPPYADELANAVKRALAVKPNVFFSVQTLVPLTSSIEAQQAALSAATPTGREIGEAIIARETSRHWVRSAARIAEDPSADTAHRVATVGLARIAVETACLDAMRLVQRSLGLSAFRQGNQVERICRDLSTYLRQPAPDEVLTEAAAWFAENYGKSAVA